MDEQQVRWEASVADALPAEVLAHIFSFADPVLVLHSEIVSHSWRDVSTSDLVWKVSLLIYLILLLIPLYPHLLLVT